MDKNIKIFEDIWNEREVDLKASLAHWDSRAEEFNNYKANKGVEEVVEFLKARGALNKESEVLDIGCGAGKYTLEFAKHSKNVLGLDISPKMIAFANDNAIENNVDNVEFQTIPWEEVDVKALNWEKRFDLVTGMMTPAISSRESLDKLIYSCKGHCLFSSHRERKEKVRNQIERDLFGRTPEDVKYGRNIYCIFNVLWQYGFNPEIFYRKNEGTRLRPIDEAINYYTVRLGLRDERYKDERKALEEYLRKISSAGSIEDEFSFNSVWIFWQNK